MFSGATSNDGTYRQGRLPQGNRSARSYPRFAVTLTLVLALAHVSISHAQAADEVSLFSPAPAAPVREIKEGDAFPDATLVASTGEKVALSSYRGQAVAITFIYTRCADAAFCPMVSQDFARTQDFLQRLGTTDHCRLLSITLDPERDTPELLAAYAQGCHADPALWTFATADAEQIRTLGGAIGLEMRRRGERIDHNLRTVVLDPAGRIAHIFRGGNWSPQELVAELQRAARRH